MKDLDQLIENAVSSRKKEKGTPLDLNTLLEMTSETISRSMFKSKDVPFSCFLEDTALSIS